MWTTALRRASVLPQLPLTAAVVPGAPDKEFAAAGGRYRPCSSHGSTEYEGSVDEAHEGSRRDGGSDAAADGVHRRRQRRIGGRGRRTRRSPSRTSPARPGRARSTRSTRTINYLSFGFVYEPLVYINALKNNADDADAREVLHVVRRTRRCSPSPSATGVKWNDGQPMTADDVAFTFNLMKTNPGLDINSLWSSILKSVSASGNTVTVQFKAAADPYFYYVAGDTPIVPSTSGAPATPRRTR